jgi:transposase-like protein
MVEQTRVRPGDRFHTPGTIMKCERCRKDKRTKRYDVDGFTGYLCEECQKKWDAITQCA